MVPQLLAYVLLLMSLAVLLSSTARIGLAVRSDDAPADVWDARLDDAQDRDAGADSDHEPVLPINRRTLAVSRGDAGPGGVSDALPGLVRTSARGRTVNTAGPPAPCGVLLYDRQVPGEGGAALDAWLRRLAEAHDRASFLASGEQRSKAAFVNKVTKRLESMGPTDWIIVHSGDHGLAFDADTDVLRSWRAVVEGKRCRFVAAAVFAEALDHSIQRTKRLFAECDCGMAEFTEELKVVMEDPAQWTGQLDQFLFNAGERAPLEMKDKVKRGMRLLREDFDVVQLAGRADITADVLKITGLTSPGLMREPPVSDGELVYSKELVSKYGKLAAANGDADFTDAVNHVYHNSLGFLLLQ